MCLQFATFIGKPVLLVLYFLNGICTYVYIYQVYINNIFQHILRKNQAGNGWAVFSANVLYKKVQKSADRIYLNPVALEANLYKSKYMYRYIYIYVYIYICIYQKLFYICVCSSQHILESQQMVLGIYIYIIVSSTMIRYILRKSQAGNGWAVFSAKVLLQKGAKECRQNIFESGCLGS